MVSKLASGDLIADRYASALYELATDSKLVDSVLADLKLLQTVLNDHKNLDFVIKNPLITSMDKLEILEKLLTNKIVNKLTLTFLKVLEKNKRFSNLYSIILQFININAYNRGDVIADITSAEKLNDEQRQNIKEQLKNTLGEKLSLNFIVDKKIIGGLVVKVGSNMIDTSLANKLNKLKIAIKGA